MPRPRQSACGAGLDHLVPLTRRICGPVARSCPSATFTHTERALGLTPAVSAAAHYNARAWMWCRRPGGTWLRDKADRVRWALGRMRPASRGSRLGPGVGAGPFVSVPGTQGASCLTGSSLLVRSPSRRGAPPACPPRPPRPSAASHAGWGTPVASTPVWPRRYGRSGN